jgi:hypothetical protein
VSTFLSTIRQWFQGPNGAITPAAGAGQRPRGLGTLGGPPSSFGPGGPTALSGGTSAGVQLALQSMDPDRLSRYSDFEAMDDHPLGAAALSIYADNATIPDAMHGRIVWAVSEDAVVRDILDDLLHRRLRIDEDVWAAVRTACRYGDNFAEVLATPEGVIGLNWLAPATVWRVVDPAGALLGYVQVPGGGLSSTPIMTAEQFARARGGALGAADARAFGPLLGAGAVYFHPWEVVHWALRGRLVRTAYGISVLDPVRWVWRRMVLLEDSSVMGQLSRGGQRFAFYVNTGDTDDASARRALNDVKNAFRKRKYINPQTGQIDLRSQVIDPQEDFWFATRNGGEDVRVEVLTGPDTSNLELMNYFRGAFLAGVQIPSGSLPGLEYQPNRAALVQEDVQFARTILRVQRAFLSGLERVAAVHLAALGIDPGAVQWGFRMNSPSSVFEMGQIEVWNSRASVAQQLEPWLPRDWILQNIFHFAQEDAVMQIQKRRDDAEVDAEAGYKFQTDMAKQYGPPDAGADDADAEAQAAAGADDAGAAPEAIQRQLAALAEAAEADRALVAGLIRRAQQTTGAAARGARAAAITEHELARRARVRKVG